MVNKIKKLWHWFLSLFSSRKKELERIPFAQMRSDQLYIRPSDWKFVSRKGEWKRQILARAKAGVERDGGKFIKINWKKQKIHYLDKHGNHLTG